MSQNHIVLLRNQMFHVKKCFGEICRMIELFSLTELLPFVEYESVGCYKDSNKRAIEKVYGGHFDFPSPYILADNYKTREQAIQKCALFAKLQRYKVFAVQDGGLCLTSPTAHKTYDKYGKSQDCRKDGKGGPWANQVYRLPETTEGRLGFCYFNIFLLAIK